MVAVKPHLAHSIQYTSVHRLKAVAHIWQSPRDDDAHGIVKIGALHLPLYVARLNIADLFPRIVIFIVSHKALIYKVIKVCKVVKVSNLTNLMNFMNLITLIQMSRFLTFLAWVWMKRLRGGTSSPMSMVNISSARSASSTLTCKRMRFSGFIVVSHS